MDETSPFGEQNIQQIHCSYDKTLLDFFTMASLTSSRMICDKGKILFWFARITEKKYQRWQRWLNDNYDGDDGDFDYNDEENYQRTYKYYNFSIKNTNI